MIHISTAETFMLDAIPMVGYCPVCCRDDQPLDVGWLQTRCNGCGSYSTFNEAQDTVRKRRELLALTRKEIGIKLGLTAKTVSNYENVWPSNKYWQATEKLMEGFK